MTFYKIVKNEKIIDVNNQFFKFLRKHLNLISCSPNTAEVVSSSDGQKFYTAEWLKPLPEGVDIEMVKVFIISEEEYNSLKEQLAVSEVIGPAPIENEPVVEEISFTPVVEEKPKEQTISIRDLYEEIQRLQAELKELRK